MMDKFRLFLTTPAGKVVAVLFCLGLVAAAVYVIKGSLGSDTPDEAKYSMYVDIETGESFRHENQLGERPPLENPKTHRNNLYAAEACYWTVDGKIKDVPDGVLLSETAHKSGPTFCPFCHRLVIPHNPKPAPGTKPPPTESEYKSRNGG